MYQIQYKPSDESEWITCYHLGKFTSGRKAHIEMMHHARLDAMPGDIYRVVDKENLVYKCTYGV